MALWWLVVQLPYPVLMALGKGVGKLASRFATRRAKIMRTNLELCFPDLAADRIDALMRENFSAAGMAVFEMAMTWWWPAARLQKICRVTGLEHLNTREGRPVLLLGIHFTTLDIGMIALSLHLQYGGMYRPHQNPVFNYVQFRGRSRLGHHSGYQPALFPRGDLRTMVRLMRQGIPVWYAPDQDYGREHSVFAPFFGIPAATITATARLASLGDAVVVPCISQRSKDRAGYELIIQPPLVNFPTGDEEADAACINLRIEEEIRRQPGQYLWAHRRFKTRPPGSARFYRAVD